MPTSTIIKSLTSGFLDLVYPPVCHHCGNALPPDAAPSFCTTCLLQLKQLQRDQCPRCAAHFPHVNTKASDCPHCHEEDYAFKQALSWGAYDSILRNIILRIKQQSNESLAYHAGTQFAQQFKEVLDAWPIDAVIPVPLHWTRRLWRGYNQAETLAQAIAQRLHKPYRPNWLWRRLQTPHQASVTPTQRRKNLRQAMTARIPKRYHGQNLLLVDDVMTTGATADACARALLTAGASAVKVVILARALGETTTPGNSPA